MPTEKMVARRAEIAANPQLQFAADRAAKRAQKAYDDALEHVGQGGAAPKHAEKMLERLNDAKFLAGQS